MSDTTEAPLEADHGSPAWIPRFVSWARNETEDLDFDGASVPDRVRELLESAGIEYANAESHDHVEPEHEIPEEQESDE